MRLHDPLILLALLAVLLMVVGSFVRTKRRAVRMSDLGILRSIPPSAAVVLRHVLLVLRVVAVTLIVVALARPQKGVEHSRVRTEGIDIQLAVDVSTSMRALDFRLKGKRADRLAVVKDVVTDFIKRREGDRIGLTLFAARAYTQCPLTVDYGMLLTLLDRAETGMMEDGTAVGSAIASAVTRLKDSPSKSKVIVLLTDGVDNASRMDPVTAAQIAETFGIKIYTVGAGTRGPVLYPVEDIFGNERLSTVTIAVDDALLQQIADTTGGKYFRATDTESLQKTYEEIDRLETTEREVEQYLEHREMFAYCLVPALVLVLTETLLSQTRFRQLP